jgi:dTDP-4-dehydrorhamnose 3,5-epimerase
MNASAPRAGPILARTAIEGVLTVDVTAIEDERGHFLETWSAAALDAAFLRLGLPAPGPFVQDSESRSRRGVLRGLHWQVAPMAQGKLVRVARGAVWDVAVDVRSDSSTRGHWVGTELSAANRRQLWLPPGIAHGFLALEDETLLLYKATAAYTPECERIVAWNDPELAIAWPLDRIGGSPLLSAKDAAALPLREP